MKVITIACCPFCKDKCLNIEKSKKIIYEDNIKWRIISKPHKIQIFRSERIKGKWSKEKEIISWLIERIAL